MSSYNLKAKNKETGEIVEVEVKNGRYYPPNDIYCYVKSKFNTLYEVIEESAVIVHNNFKEDVEEKLRLASTKDTPVIKENLKTDTQEWWRERFRNLFYKWYNTDFYEAGCIEKLIEDIETQAYKQGQADAYRESASVARKAHKNSQMLLHFPGSSLEKVKRGYQDACTDITRGIEQLSSNKE
jgi:hypothetical protein